MADLLEIGAIVVGSALVWLLLARFVITLNRAAARNEHRELPRGKAADPRNQELAQMIQRTIEVPEEM